MNKNNQRQICLDNRSKIDPELRKEYSQIICDKLLKLELRGNIMSYYPIKDEVNPLFFNNKKCVAYPVIMTDKQMDIYLPINNDFIMNYYKIPEPNTSTGVKMDKEYISTVIVPCVGFDERCYRIGYGGGYYDRFLRDYKVRKIGICFEACKVDEIITDEYDIQLDMIVTEVNTYGSIKR